MFERHVGEYQTLSGEVLGAQFKCAVLLERVPPELWTHLLLTCGSDYAIMADPANVNWRSTNGNRRRERKANTSKERRARTDKHKGRHDSSPKLEDHCGHCGMWRHKKNTLDTRTLLLRWMRRSLPNLQTVMRAGARLVCFQLEPRSLQQERSPL